MPINVTGNRAIDQATAEFAVAIAWRNGEKPDQFYYDEAMRLRDEIMKGTRELDAGES